MSRIPQPGTPRPDGAEQDTRGPDPEVLAALVQQCPAVAGLHGGQFGEVATYLPSRRVRGVRVGEREVEIHVIGRYPATMHDIAAQVRAAVTAHADGRAISIAIDDLALPGEPDPDDALVHESPRHTDPDADPSPDPGGPRPDAPTFPPPATRPATPQSGSPSHRLDTKEPSR